MTILEILIKDKKEFSELINKLDDECILIYEFKEEKTDDSDRRKGSGT